MRLAAHFGHWREVGRRGRHRLRWQVAAGLIYGQVKKCYRRRKLVRVTHVMRLGTKDDLTATLQGLGFSGRLNTAFIERVNLTVRHGVAALARRTWATAQQSPGLLATLQWWRAYYHFVRPHASLRVALVQPQMRGGKRLVQRYRQRTLICRVAWSPDGRQLASGGGGRGSGELFIWDVHSGELPQSWDEPNAIVEALAWSPAGEMVLSGSSDGMLCWWDPSSGKRVRARTGHQGAIQSLSVSPEGKRVASCGDDNAIQVWDVQSGEYLQTLRRDRPYERLNITGIKCLSDAQKASLCALGAFEETGNDG